MNSQQWGLTLVELLISLALASVITTGMTKLYIELRRQEHTANALAEVYENGQLALDLLQYEIRMAGFSPIDAVTTPHDFPCAQAFAWLVDFQHPLDVQANHLTSVLDVPFTHGCLRIQAVPDSDILWVRRIASQPIMLNQPLSAGWYLWVANEASEEIAAYQLRFVSGWQDVSLEERDFYQLWALHSRIYYLRAYSAVAGDGVVSLVMATPNATGFQHQVLIEGIEMMQFAWLIKNGETFYRPTKPNRDQLAQVKAMQIHLLVKHRHALGEDIPLKNYQLVKPVIPTDKRFFREVFSSSVALRNQGGE